MIINDEKSLHHTYVWIQIESYHKSFSIAIAWLDLYPCRFRPVASVSVCANWLLIVYNILLILSRNYMHYNRRPFAFLVEFLNRTILTNWTVLFSHSLSIIKNRMLLNEMKGKNKQNNMEMAKVKKSTHTTNNRLSLAQNESCAHKINNNALCRLQSIP